ncbi:GTPase IMAP family member 9-like [Nelusetta ayraudi]|uniref:GTPase IMAP family member 9-like n=1 Tax=Nelusetta ayraudi TaxID=303726 RepID=UPI003F6FCF6C
MTSDNIYGKLELRIVMLGRTGNGKSATGNTILERHCFESKLAAKSMTVDCAKGRAVVDGQKVSVIDTPGLFDTRFGMDKTSQDMTKCISFASPGPHIFLVVIRLGRFTDEEKRTVQKIQEIFGQAADRYSMVLFTGGDLLEGTMEEFLEESQELQDLVARCNGQFHVFNNKSKDRTQVKELLQKIRNIVMKNGGNHYTNKMLWEAERATQEEQKRIQREKEEKMQRERDRMERAYKERLRKHAEHLEAERERERREEEEERRRESRRREKERMIWEAERRREQERRDVERRREEKERAEALENMRRRLEEERREREAERERQEERERQRRQEQQQAESNDDCTIL